MQILDKIFLGNKQSAYDEILNIYKNNGHCIVNFVYFATLEKAKLLSNSGKDIDYEKALIKGDLLLPDGIAMYLLMKKYKKTKINNLNGTDFLPYFIERSKEFKFNYIFYGAQSGVISEAVMNIKKKYGIQIISYQDGYSSFDINNLKNIEKGTILIVGLGSPKQEKWAINNYDIIKKNNLIVFTVGGLFDFWGKKEIRAPFFLRKTKLEWLRRLLINPKKNFNKVLNSLIILKYLLKNS